MKSTALLYRLLGDEARLRLLRVLVKERLNVTELTGVLGLAQSGVSRHLGLLKDAGLGEFMIFIDGESECLGYRRHGAR